MSSAVTGKVIVLDHEDAARVAHSLREGAQRWRAAAEQLEEKEGTTDAVAGYREVADERDSLANLFMTEEEMMNRTLGTPRKDKISILMG